MRIAVPVGPRPRSSSAQVTNPGFYIVFGGTLGGNHPYGLGFVLLRISHPGQRVPAVLHQNAAHAVQQSLLVACMQQQLVAVAQRAQGPVQVTESLLRLLAFGDVDAHLHDQRRAVDVRKRHVVDGVVAPIRPQPFPMVGPSGLKNLEGFAVLARFRALEQILVATPALGFAEMLLEIGIREGHVIVPRQQHHVRGHHAEHAGQPLPFQPHGFIQPPQLFVPPITS